MTISLGIILIAAVWGAYRLASDYVRRSLRSFSSADQVFGKIEAASNSILDKPVPQSVARFVVALVATAGCGCFVRGMLMSHYLPRATLKNQSANSPVSLAMNDIDNLAPDIRKMVWDVVALVVVYDSYRNPLQGWLLRHTLKSFSTTSSQISIETKLETWQTAVSVLGRRKVTAV